VTDDSERNGPRGAHPCGGHGRSRARGRVADSLSPCISVEGAKVKLSAPGGSDLEVAFPLFPRHRRPGKGTEPSRSVPRPPSLARLEGERHKPRRTGRSTARCVPPWERGREEGAAGKNQGMQWSSPRLSSPRVQLDPLPPLHLFPALGPPASRPLRRSRRE
jgi:hypothetical protein